MDTLVHSTMSDPRGYEALVSHRTAAMLELAGERGCLREPALRRFSQAVDERGLATRGGALTLSGGVASAVRILDRAESPCFSFVRLIDNKVSLTAATRRVK